MQRMKLTGKIPEGCDTAGLQRAIDATVLTVATHTVSGEQQSFRP